MLTHVATKHATSGPERLATRSWRAPSPARRAAGTCVLAIGGAAVAYVIQDRFLHQQMALAFLLGAALLVPLEQLRPRRRARVLRVGWTADVVHSLSSGFTARALGYPALVLAAVISHTLVPARLVVEVAAQPGWLKVVETLVVMVIGGYWAHRLMHEVPWLWSFHKIHHAIPDMDWLSGRRNHPVSNAFNLLFQAVPLVLVGMDVRLILVMDVLLGLHTLFAHANVQWHCHWLGRIIVTPDYHHWHHSTDVAHHDTNYASELPLLDMIFGTYNFPRDDYADELGLADEISPTTYVGQLLWPIHHMAETVAADSDVHGAAA